MSRLVPSRRVRLGCACQREAALSLRYPFFPLNSRTVLGSTCTSTRTKAWWQVDLAFEMPIERMVVFNRWDGPELAKRLDGAEALVLDSSGRVIWKQKLPIPAPRRTDLEVGLVDLSRLVPDR